MKIAKAVHDYISLKQSLGSRFHAEATILKAFCNALGEVNIVDVEPQHVNSYLYPVPHRQYVFSIPIILRKFFRYNRDLLSDLSKCAADSLLTFFSTALGMEDGICGAVMTIQTFGDYARWHPHIHSIVADGLFGRNGIFHVMPRISIKPLAELFRANVLTMLKRNELIDDQFIAMIMKWRHTSGFSVDNSVCIARDDEVGVTNLAQYIIRSPFSISKNKKNFKFFTAEEFIAAITQHKGVEKWPVCVLSGLSCRSACAIFSLRESQRLILTSFLLSNLSTYRYR